MPAKSCSLYEIAGEHSLEGFRSTLEGATSSQTVDILGEPYDLRTTVTDLTWGPEMESLWGSISFETLQRIPQFDGTSTLVPATRRAMFAFFEAEASLYLAVFCNRGTAETSAMKLDSLLTHSEDEHAPIVYNHRIPTQAIEQFLNNHSHTKKLGGWRDLDYVGVSNSTLHGADIDRYRGTQEYDLHGSKKYVMVELHDSGHVVRISEEGIVTFYRDIRQPEILDFVRTEILPLI